MRARAAMAETVRWVLVALTLLVWSVPPLLGILHCLRYMHSGEVP
jgi:hypothetical protein